MAFATMDGNVVETDDLLWPDTSAGRQELPIIGTIFDAEQKVQIVGLCEEFQDIF